MTKKMPISLPNSPIVESIFEFRYSSDIDVSTIIPGILHTQLEGEKIIQPTPPIPLEVIKLDQNMQGIPTFSMRWKQYIILGNPHFVAVSFQSPYTGWENFISGVKDIHNILLNANIFSKITRYSLKYVDFIKLDNIEPMQLLDINLNISDRNIRDESLVLQIELPNSDFLHVLKIATSATLNINDTTNKGLLIDIDTLYIQEPDLKPQTFWNEYEQRVSIIHDSSKKLFFSILSKYGIDFLRG